MGIYERYLEKTAQVYEAEEVNAVEEQRVQVILEKTAEAEYLIKEAGITEYTNEDLADVVTELINNDIEAEEETNKTAELYDYGRIMSHGIHDGLMEIFNSQEQ